MIRIINADVIDGLRSLPEKSVHCVVTSPPYWGLRDYGVEGQIGLEPTPEEYLEKMMQVFREVHRVLRDDGTLWLNIGDSYANAQPRGRMEDQGDLSTGDHGELIPKRDWSCWNLKQKDLVGMCWRVAFALQAEGWYLRSDIVWAKPNPMPESITDRPTRSHEYVFLLAKSARYFYDVDAVREAHEPATIERAKNPKTTNPSWHTVPGTEKRWNVEERKLNPAGRNRRDVWTITTQPTPEAHFATFPEALVEPCIKAGTSERGCCSVCGAPWVRVVEKEIPEARGNNHRDNGYLSPSKIPRSKNDQNPIVRTIDWQPSCTCNAETVPCVVLDPFGGSGTVAKVARDLNRDAVLIEINPAYVEIARRKLRADEQIFENVKVITA
jgi:DNA modification methylase